MKYFITQHLEWQKLIRKLFSEILTQTVSLVTERRESVWPKIREMKYSKFRARN